MRGPDQRRVESSVEHAGHGIYIKHYHHSQHNNNTRHIRKQSNYRSPTEHFNLNQKSLLELKNGRTEIFHLVFCLRIQCTNQLALVRENKQESFWY